jgi:hypothetical protein
VEILQPPHAGAGEVKLHRIPTESAGLASTGRSTAAVAVSLLTLACTGVALLDLFLLAFHIS